MMILLKADQDGAFVNKEWTGELGVGFVRESPEGFQFRSIAAISVDENSIQVYTLPADAIGVSFTILVGPVWYGGPELAPNSNIGQRVLTNATLQYRPVKAGFKLRFKCAAGETATIGVNEFVSDP